MRQLAVPAPAPTRPPTERPRSSPAVLAFIGLLVVLGLLAVAPGIEVGAPLPWAELGFFFALAAAAEWFGIGVDYGRGRTSVSVVPMLGAALVDGGPGCLAAAAAFALTAAIKSRAPVDRLLFNFGMMLLALEAALLAFRALAPGPLEPSRFEGLILPAVAAGLVFYAVNVGLICLVRGMTERRAPLAIWEQSYRWLLPHYTVLGGLGLVVALGYRVFGWTGVIALMAPVAMMHLAIQQYVERTTANIRQLHALNDQLEGEIAQRRVAEAESARLAAEAARASALEELNRLKSEFISIASHELRTPMTTILGFSDLLLDRSVPEEQRQHWLYLINREAEQLSALVDNLLDASRIESGRLTLHPEPVDLLQVIEPVVAPLRASALRHSVTVDVPPEARWVLVDRAKLRQILTNLVNNALKYSPKGGRVMIAARWHDNEALVEISVADEGLGIPAEMQARIFDRFQRAETARTRGIRGSGLGLYIVRQLVELHGGTVWLESAEGRGSTFYFTLPPAPAQSEEPVVPVVARDAK